MGWTSFFATALAAALPLLAALSASLAPGAAVAAPSPEDGKATTNDDDPGINYEGEIVNRLLAVLRLSPNGVSQACLDSLKDMHEADDALAKESKAESNQDIAVARDIAGSAMETVVSSCGVDTKAVCALPNQSPALASACAHVPKDQN